jgi:hypothetical protein
MAKTAPWFAPYSLRKTVTKTKILLTASGRLTTKNETLPPDR